MYKIEFIPTGHTFELPDITAEELKEKFPEDYKILEKNGIKFFGGQIEIINDEYIKSCIRENNIDINLINLRNVPTRGFCRYSSIWRKCSKIFVGVIKALLELSHNITTLPLRMFILTKSGLSLYLTRG